MVTTNILQSPTICTIHSISDFENRNYGLANTIFTLYSGTDYILIQISWHQLNCINTIIVLASPLFLFSKSEILWIHWIVQIAKPVLC